MLCVMLSSNLESFDTSISCPNHSMHSHSLALPSLQSAALVCSLDAPSLQNIIEAFSNHTLPSIIAGRSDTCFDKILLIIRKVNIYCRKTIIIFTSSTYLLHDRHLCIFRSNLQAVHDHASPLGLQAIHAQLASRLRLTILHYQHASPRKDSKR